MTLVSRVLTITTGNTYPFARKCVIGDKHGEIPPPKSTIRQCCRYLWLGLSNLTVLHDVYNENLLKKYLWKLMAYIVDIEDLFLSEWHSNCRSISLVAAYTKIYVQM